MLALRDASAGSEVWSTDVAVPLSRLPDLIELTAKTLPKLPPPSTTSLLGHIGDGNFHASLLYDARDPAQHAAVKECVETMVERALAMDGTCSGEHGIGLGKKECLLKELGGETVGVMVLLKKALDERWLMNPGKVIDWPGEGAWKGEVVEKGVRMFGSRPDQLDESLKVEHVVADHEKGLDHLKEA
jgi:D-lactate dehydrogenase (cytochrome)